MTQIYVYDPTITDSLSKVRGVGRYVKLLEEALENDAVFTGNLHDVTSESTFINPFFDPLKPPLLRKRLAKKQVAVIHDLIPLKYPHAFPSGIRGRINVFFNRLALKYYDTIVTDSEVSKHDIIEILGVAPEKIKIIYPVLMPFFFSHTSSSSTSDLRSRTYCIYAGDATWNKNICNIAKAIKLADIHCIFVGKVFGTSDLRPPTSDLTHPWQKELKEFFEIVKGDDHFSFPGYVSDEELIHLYKNAKVNLLVSRDEGFGFSYVEAAACATPSILADRPIFHETAGDTALFVNPENPTEITNAILKLMETEKLRSSLGEKAQERIEKYTISQFRNDWKKIIEG